MTFTQVLDHKLAPIEQNTVKHRTLYIKNTETASSATIVLDDCDLKIPLNQVIQRNLPHGSKFDNMSMCVVEKGNVLNPHLATNYLFLNGQSHAELMICPMTTNQSKAQKGGFIIPQKLSNTTEIQNTQYIEQKTFAPIDTDINKAKHTGDTLISDKTMSDDDLNRIMGYVTITVNTVSDKTTVSIPKSIDTLEQLGTYLVDKSVITNSNPMFFLSTKQMSDQDIVLAHEGNIIVR